MKVRSYKQTQFTITVKQELTYFIRYPLANNITGFMVEHELLPTKTFSRYPYDKELSGKFFGNYIFCYNGVRPMSLIKD